jgi:hypothetical protein
LRPEVPELVIAFGEQDVAPPGTWPIARQVHGRW